MAMLEDVSPYVEQETEQPSKWAWPLTWLLAILPFLGYWTYGLFDLDEGFYGAVVSEMNRRGEWITPYYNGHPWFEKPILLYWAAKPCMLAFGNALGPRLPSVLATLGLFWLVSNFIRRRFSDAAGQRTVLILASSLLVVGAGRMMLVDPILNLCFSGAMLFFWDSLFPVNKYSRIVAAALLGLSVLAKGPVGAILFVLVAGITFWREPALRQRFRGGWMVSTLVFLIAVAVWYVPAYLRDGQLFVQKFLIEQNLQRFTGGDSAHSVGLAGLPFYLPVLFLGMLPWTIYVFKAWPRGMKDGEQEALRRYLAVWALVALGFFTLSGTKLIHYILPACVPIAILVGEWLARRSGAPKAVSPTRLGGHVAAVVVVWGIAQFGAAYYYGLFHAEVHRIAAYVKDQPGQVAVFQMPRREAGLGTMKPKIQETSHPSLVMYLDRNVMEVENFEDLMNGPKPLWIITRMGRITDDQFHEASLHNLKLKVVPVPNAERNYVLYRLDTSALNRDRR